MTITASQNVVFKHMIELKSCGCVFCYTQEEGSGRTRIFLVFNEKRRVYARNGLKSIWEEMQSPEEAAYILAAYDKAVSEEKIPCFATSVQELVYV